MLYLLIGYMFLFIHRPFEVWPALGDIHLERLYVGATLMVLLFYGGKKWTGNVQHVAYFAFAGAVLFCWVASPWADKGQEGVLNYFKLLVFYVMIVLVVHDERSLKLLLFAFLVIMALYMAHSLREYRSGRHAFRMGIARMIGVDKTLGDPNSFGASIVYALPFIVPFWMTNPSRRVRCFLVGYALLSVGCIALTGSRSSFVGLLFWVGMMAFKSRWRWRVVAAGVLAAPILWAVLPPSLQNRFETIIHPEVGPAAAKASGEDRFLGLRLGIQLLGQFPATGCGPGAWKSATGMKIESHNLFGQLVGEMGVLGFLTFAAILWCFWVNLRWVRRVYREHPEWGRDFLYYATGAIGWGVFLLLFEGNFGHNLFRFSWLWYGGFLIIARHCLQQRLLAEQYGFWYAPEYEPAAPALTLASRGA
jgi:hypothetical protein